MFYLWNCRRRYIFRRAPNKRISSMQIVFFTFYRKSLETNYVWDLTIHMVSLECFSFRWIIERYFFVGRGCNSWSLLKDAIGPIGKRTRQPLEQYITWTRTIQCPTAKTHTPHCMQEDQHTVRWLHRTVYIPWLVASYNMHKGKCWLNFNPPKPQGSRVLIIVCTGCPNAWPAKDKKM